jgi:hypothetical protein
MLNKRTWALGLFITLTTALWAQSEFFNTVEFRNKTKGEIYYLFCSPGDSEFWGPDVLGSNNTLDAGGRAEFYISYPETSNTFDFMAIDEFGNTYQLFEKEITDGTAAKFVISEDLIIDSVDLDILEDNLIALEIMNLTGFEIYYLFVSPSDSAMYGIDFMDSETTLPDEESISLLFFKDDTSIDYDIQGIDEDEDTYSFSLTLDPELGDQTVDINYDDMDS